MQNQSNHGWKRQHWESLRKLVNGEVFRLLEPLTEEAWNFQTQRKANKILSSWLDKRMKGDLKDQYPPIQPNHVWFVSLDFPVSKGMTIHIFHRPPNPNRQAGGRTDKGEGNGN
jgi:hypothetical protein